MTDICIYHDKCVDGFAAAWCVYMKYPDAQFIAATHGDPPPDVTGKNVTIVDFSYRRQLLLHMHGQAESLQVIDHHKTAEADLKGLAFCTFDMNRSGAGMAWDILHTQQHRPAFINYVEDRDLWRFALADSKVVHAYIETVPFTFRDYDKLSGMHIHEMFKLGAGALSKIEQYVREVAKHAQEYMIDGVLVPVVNAPHVNTSDLVGHLAEQSGVFAVGWFKRSDGQFQYSLRSRGDYDVSALAKLHGGGGHKNAAGFAVHTPPWETF